MAAEPLTCIRELDSRETSGCEVRLLWCELDGRLSVTVHETRTGESFCIHVREDERPLDVFEHPFAYAAHHGTDIDRLGRSVDRVAAGAKAPRDRHSRATGAT